MRVKPQLPSEQLLQTVEVGFSAAVLIEVSLLTVMHWLDKPQPMQSNPAKFVLCTWAALWACCQRGTGEESSGFINHKMEKKKRAAKTGHMVPESYLCPNF